MPLDYDPILIVVKLSSVEVSRRRAIRKKHFLVQTKKQKHFELLNQNARLPFHWTGLAQVLFSTRPQ